MTNAHDPALPNIGDHAGPDMPGLTAIEHAALVTGQPCSGTPWLDEMIRAQRRERLAGQALQTLIAIDPKNTHALDNPNGRTWDDWIAMNACGIADTLIDALKGGAK